MTRVLICLNIYLFIKFYAVYARAELEYFVTFLSFWSMVHGK